MKPLVSVLIPMYNEENGIRKTLNSILAQTYSNYEIIVVDDGSTDRSAEIVRAEYPQVKLIQQENQGIAVALNTGLEHCQGEFIARIDCNDESYPTRLEKQVRFLQENPDVGLVGGHIMLFEKDGTEIGIIKYPTTPKKALRNLLRHTPSISHTVALIRKSVLEETGNYDPFFNGREDIELWCRISLLYKITNLDELVVRSLSTTGGISFRGINLSLLYDLALIEREERKGKGIKWKNQQLRDGHLQQISSLKNQQFSEKDIERHRAIHYSRRAGFILRSGDRQNAVREYKRAMQQDPSYLKGRLGLIIAYLAPIFIIRWIFGLYHRGRHITFLIKRSLHLAQNILPQ